MPFLKSINNTITFPYDPSLDYPNTSFPTGVDHPSFDIYWVHPSPQNNPDPSLYNAVEGQPVFNAETNRWEQTWDYVEKSPEEKRQAKYDPATFLMTAQADPDFRTWRSQLPPQEYTELLTAAGDAKQTGNWTAFQSLLDIRSVDFSPALLAKIQALVEQYGIPIVVEALP